MKTFKRTEWVRYGKSRAFSLVEVIITAAIVAIGLTAMLQLLSSALNTAFGDTDAIIAAELAQEGLEYAYNVRDTNLANGRLAFPMSGAFQFPGKNNRDFCGPDFVTPTFVLSGVGKNCFASARQSETRYSLALQGNFYRFQNAVTHFARVVSIDLDNNTNPTQAEVTSIVWWGESDVLPTGVFPGVNADNVDVSQCTRAHQCVYTRAILTGWKP
ncbi:MAG: type II secretion system protein [Candidatus Moranbacteria bacterium]|nr:type II secretion system protein [Candidatus Moranbacteria bacterium]